MTHPLILQGRQCLWLEWSETFSLLPLERRKGSKKGKGGLASSEQFPSSSRAKGTQEASSESFVDLGAFYENLQVSSGAEVLIGVTTNPGG